MYSIYWGYMPRRDDIRGAFVSAIRVNKQHGQHVYTDDFLRELDCVGWIWTHRQANEWIEHYQQLFTDKTPDHSENRLWRMLIMGYVM